MTTAAPTPSATQTTRDLSGPGDVRSGRRRVGVPDGPEREQAGRTSAHDGGRPSRRSGAAVPRWVTWALDGVLAAVVAATGLWTNGIFAEQGDSGYGYAFRELDTLGVLLVLLLTAAMLTRRRFPVTTALGTAACTVTLSLLHYGTLAPAIALLVMVYACGAFAPLLPGVLGLVALQLVSMAMSVRNALLTDQPLIDILMALLGTLAMLGLYLFGRSLQRRRRYTHELEARAERLERTHEAEVRAALAEERARIARELHDVVAHHVSVMTVQAAAARRTLHRDAELSDAAMAAVESTGRSAMTEMRRVVGVLRLAEPATHDDGPVTAEREPQPGVADLDALRDLVQTAGVPVDLTVTGQVEHLPAGLGITVYRIVQEALTNTIKHAGPTGAGVTIRCGEHQVVVHVVDDGAGPGESAERRRPGHGLLGMRERVALYGGTLHVGARPGGGFEVRARIPVEGATP